MTEKKTHNHQIVLIYKINLQSIKFYFAMLTNIDANGWWMPLCSGNSIHATLDA